jgi:hypothetical protein
MPFKITMTVLCKEGTPRKNSRELESTSYDIMRALSSYFDETFIVVALSFCLLHFKLMSSEILVF